VFRRALQLSLVVLAAAASGFPSQATEPAAGRLSLGYRATMAGLPVATAAVQVAADATDYRLDSRLETHGLLKLLLPWRHEAVSYGRIEADGLAPTRFWGAGTYKGEPRHMQLTYAGGNARIDSAEPHPAEKPDRLVPPGLRRGTLDPLSALLAVGRRIGAGGRCDGRLAVFDGRQRFDLHVTDAEADLSAAKLDRPGATVRCNFFYEPVAGFKKKHRPVAASRERPGTIWFQQFRPGLPAVPVRIEADTDYGRFVIELTEAVPGRQTAAR